MKGIVKERSINQMVSLPISLRERLVEESKRTGEAMSKIVQEALEKRLEQNEQGKSAET